MCKCFGDSLDRLTMWDKIAAAMAAGCAETRSGDVETFLSVCLGQVQAEPAAASRFQPYIQLLDTLMSWPYEMRVAFLDHVERKPFVVLTHGRKRWEEYKAMTAAQKAALGAEEPSEEPAEVEVIA